MIEWKTKTLMPEKLKLVYSEYQLDQLIKSYTRVISRSISTDQGDKRISE